MLLRQMINKVYHFILKIKLFLMVTIIVCLSLYGYIVYRLHYPSTNDARIDASVFPISAQLSGIVKKTYVKDNQWVKAGSLLFELLDEPYLVAVKKQNAEVAVAKDTIKKDQQKLLADKSALDVLTIEKNLAAKQLNRMKTLVKKDNVSQLQYDEALDKFNVINAKIIEKKHIIAQDFIISARNQSKLQIARQDLAKAQIALSYTKIYAPTTGYISNYRLEQGAPVTAFEPVFSVVKQNAWVSANFLESELLYIRSNQKASVRLLMYPNKIFKAYVGSIGAGISSPLTDSTTLLPKVSPTLNWLRITQRFPVRIYFKDFDPHYPMRVGANARVVINTHQLIDHA